MRTLIFCMIGILILVSTFSACSANKLEETSSDLQHIKNVVNLRSTQLAQIYQKHNNIKPQSGSLKIKLFITDQGTVQNTDLVVDSGSFTPEFVTDIRNKLLSWEFIINEPHVYSYKQVFGKN